MVLVQPVNFHLSTDETMFGQIVRLEDGTFSAQVTGALRARHAKTQRTFQWLTCPAGGVAITAFDIILNAVNQRCQTDGGKRVVMVSNPQGWLLLTRMKEKEIVGNDVAVVEQAPIGLIEPLNWSATS